MEIKTRRVCGIICISMKKVVPLWACFTHLTATDNTIVMKKYRFSAFLILLLLSTGLGFAQIDHLEIGLQGGAGVYVCNPDVDRPAQRKSLAFIGDVGGADPKAGKFPVMEQYGAFVRYRFDNHWNIVAEATRQRVFFKEHHSGVGVNDKNYYNAAWHVDALAEYNILSYGQTDNWGAELEYYQATPFVTIGVGMTVFNENATWRDLSSNPGFYIKEMYPTLIGNSHKVAMYVPVGLGVKWRVMSSLQLQASMKYHLYVLNGDIEGGTPNLPFDDIQFGFFKNHNALFSLGIVYNFSQAEHRTGHRIIKWED